MNPPRTLAGAAAVAVAVAAILLTAGCSHSYGVTGTVQSKEADRECKKNKAGKPTTSCTTEWEIDLIQDDGTSVEVKAFSRTDFDRCQVGERFPECTR